MSSTHLSSRYQSETSVKPSRHTPVPHLWQQILGKCFWASPVTASTSFLLGRVRGFRQGAGRFVRPGVISDASRSLPEGSAGRRKQLQRDFPILPIGAPLGGGGFSAHRQRSSGQPPSQPPRSLAVASRPEPQLGCSLPSSVTNRGSREPGRPRCASPKREAAGEAPQPFSSRTSPLLCPAP